MDAIGDLREEVSLMDVLQLWGETTNLTQGIYWQRYKGGGCFCWGSKQQGTDQRQAYIGFLSGSGSMKWSSLVWDWWDYCDLILGARSGIGGIFFSWPGLRLGLKSGSRCSFLELFTLQRNWWVWLLWDRWGFVSFQSGSELGLMPSRLYNKSLLWDLSKSQPPSFPQLK